MQIQSRIKEQIYQSSQNKDSECRQDEFSCTMQQAKKDEFEEHSVRDEHSVHSSSSSDMMMDMSENPHAYHHHPSNVKQMIEKDCNN